MSRGRCTARTQPIFHPPAAWVAALEAIIIIMMMMMITISCIVIVIMITIIIINTNTNINTLLLMLLVFCFLFIIIIIINNTNTWVAALEAIGGAANLYEGAGSVRFVSVPDLFESSSDRSGSVLIPSLYRELIGSD